MELGFGPFLSIKTCDMRLGLFWAPLERYHAETCTFHFSCGEYVVLPIDWTAILGIRFGGNPIPDECVSEAEARYLFGLVYPLPVEWKRLFLESAQGLRSRVDVLGSTI